MPQREYIPDGYKIAKEAWDHFDRWCSQHDPEGNMETVDLVEAYARAHGVTLPNGE